MFRTAEEWPKDRSKLRTPEGPSPQIAWAGHEAIGMVMVHTPMMAQKSMMITCSGY